MALPSSGPISMSMVRTELGVPTQAPFSLNTAEDGGYATLNTCSYDRPSSANPASISEWYGYCHTCTCCVCYTFINTSGLDKNIDIWVCGDTGYTTFTIPGTGNTKLTKCIDQASGGYIPVVGITAYNCVGSGSLCNFNSNCPDCSCQYIPC